MAEQAVWADVGLQADLAAAAAAGATAAAAVGAAVIPAVAVETPGATTAELEDTAAGAVATIPEPTPLCR
jgi:hypothetical protein